MVQEDLAISPRRLYESYFLLLIWVVKFFQIAKEKIYKHDTVTSSKIRLTKRCIPSTTQTSQPPRRKDKKMRDEKKGK